MKVKIFFEPTEKEINDWLSDNEVEIFKILQSESQGDDENQPISLTITIFYRMAE